jgi:hypothetical protein
MNKYISPSLKILKYVGIALLVGYLVMVVNTLNEQRDEDLTLKERVANATLGSLYSAVMNISMFLSEPTDPDHE